MPVRSTGMTNNQFPISNKFPMSNDQFSNDKKFGNWNLKLEIYLVIEIWDLEFPLLCSGWFPGRLPG
jgi:hypothetical protein